MLSPGDVRTSPLEATSATSFHTLSPSACAPVCHCHLYFICLSPGPDTKSLLNQNGRLTKFLSCCCNILYHTLVPTKNNPVCVMYRDTPAGSEGNADFMSASISNLPLVRAHEIGTMTIHLTGGKLRLMRCPVCELVSLSVTGPRIPRNEELNKPVWAQYVIFIIHIETQLRSWTKTTTLCQRAEAPTSIRMTAGPEGWWNRAGVGWGVKNQSSKNLEAEMSENCAKIVC